MNKQERLEKINNYMSKGFLREALMEFQGTFLENETIHVHGILTELELKNIQRILHPGEYGVERNRISVEVMTLIQH